MVTEKSIAEPSDPLAHGGPEIPIVASESLFRGHREVIVTNGADAYRLRLTSKGKLILTK